jgi:hypothetical protein
MIEFKPGNYYVAFWFVGGKDTDWLAAAWRDGDRWIIRSRFRYHSPDSRDPFDDHDAKSWSNVESPAAAKTEEQIVAEVGLIAGLVGQRLGVVPEFVPVHGDCDKALFELALQPWAHIKLTPKTGGR